MKLSQLDGGVLGDAALAALEEDAPREPLYQALLEQPIALVEVGPGAPPGPTLRVTLPPPSGSLPQVPPLPPPTVTVRLVESPRLGAPVIPLYTTGAAAVEAAEERELWPDGAPRGAVVERGGVFPSLRGHPGAHVVVRKGREVPLDAGELAALAERVTPTEYLETIRKLIAAGRPREAARKLAVRPLYTLGHPQGGMLMFQRDLPCFLHLATAERFARRMQEQTGGRIEQGLVAAAELFKHAARGKLHILIDPGPSSFKLKPDDLR